MLVSRRMIDSMLVS